MAWQTQMQQALARGPAGAATGTLGQSVTGPQMPQPAGAVPAGSRTTNPYDLGAQFNAYYGGVPTHQIVTGMQEGRPPQVSQIGPGGSVATPQASVSASPEQAGKMNAISPGIFNGNPANGVPSKEEGFTKALAGGGVMPMPTVRKPSAPPTQTTASAPVPPPATAPQQPAPQPAPAPAPPPPPPSDVQMPMVKSSTAAPVQPGEQPSLVTAMQEAQSADTRATAESAPAPLADVTTAEEEKIHVSPQGIKFTLKPGVKYPKGFAEWSDGKKTKWIAENGIPVFQGQADATWALNKDPHLTDLVLPTAKTVAAPTLVSGMSALQISDTLKDPSLVRLAQRGQEILATLSAPQQAGTGGNIDRESNLKDLELLDSIEKALAAYDIYLRPEKMPQTAPPPGGDTGGQTQPPPPPPSGGTGTTPPPGDGTTETPVVPGPGGDQIGAPADEYVGTNLDLSTPQSTIQELIAYYQKHGWGDKSLAMAEATFAAQQQQALNNNRQAGVNVFGNALDAFQNSPLYTGVQKSAQEMLDEGSPIPWETVKNQYVTGLDKGVSADMDALSQSLNRRGLGPASGAGIAANQLRLAEGDKAMGLGQLDIQQATTDRALKEAAMRNALAAMAGTSGVTLSGAGNLANFITGDPAQYGNPYSGIASAFVNADAQALADKAQNFAEQFTWEDAIALTAKLGEAAAEFA